MKRLLLFTLFVLFFTYSGGYAAKDKRNFSLKNNYSVAADTGYTISGYQYRDLDFDFETADDWVDVRGWKFYLLD